jgi:hypothetical protein
MELESGTSRSVSSPSRGQGGATEGGGGCCAFSCVPCARDQQPGAKDKDVEGIKGTRWATVLMILVWITAIVFRYLEATLCL